MAKTASGKYAKAISDRSGMEFPYRQMVTEWNGSFVHLSEFEPKQPQLEPKAHASDGIALPGQVRSDRTEFATPIVLINNPFVTSSSLTSVVTSTSKDSKGIDTNPFQTSDAIRFTKVKSSAGSVVSSIFELETTLNETLTDSDTTITLSDATNFPTSGFIVIEKVLTSTSLTSVLVSTSKDSKGIDTNPFQTSDAIRFTKVKSSSGNVVPSIFELETTLNETLSATDTTITLSDATNFPTSGFIVIEKILTSSDTSNTLLQGTIADETIQYTGKTGNNLTGCTRGTAAQIEGFAPSVTTARTHNSGAKVFGSYIITRTTSSVTNNGISISYSFSFSFSLASAATTGGTGGGNFVFAGPVNQRG